MVIIDDPVPERRRVAPSRALSEALADWRAQQGLPEPRLGVWRQDAMWALLRELEP